MAFSQVLSAPDLSHISQETRQPQREERYVGDEQEHQEYRDEERYQIADDRFNLDPSHTDADEKSRADRRCDRSDAEIKDHEDTEVNGIDAQRVADRKEDRREDKAGRCHIHECSYDQQQEVDDQKDDVFVTCQRKQSR